MPAPTTFTRLLPSLMLMLLLPLAASAQLANVTPAFLDFGPVKMGATVTVPLTISNLSPFPLAVAGGGTGGGNGFSALGGTCAGSVAANSSCTINYLFRPQAASGTVSDSTLLELSGGGQLQFATLALQGTGDEALAQVSPRSIDFGEEFFGQTVTIPVTITNTHSATLNLAGGGVGAPFSAIGGMPSCGGGIAPGASCQINYNFTPSQVNEASAATTISLSDGVSLTQDFSLQVRGRGRANVGVVSVAPVDIDFGDIKLGTPVEVRVRSTNRTASNLQRAGGGFNDNDNAFIGFGSNDPGCGGGAHPSGATCSNAYFFQPRERRAHAASTAIEFSGSGNFASVALSFSGFGVGRLARVSPVAIDFGAIRAGTQVSVPVTVLNTSTATLTNIIGGNVSGEFSRTTTCGASLSIGASCTLTYRFQPFSDGDFQTTTLLSYTNISGTQETVQIDLNGTGTTAIFSDGFE